MRSLFLCAGLAVAAGCSSEDKLYDVSGTVTFDGKPVAKGSIRFDPDAARGATGAGGFAAIEDGRYDTAKPGGKGVKGGWHTVRVSGFDGKPGDDQPLGRTLFPEHSETKELPAAASTLDVTVGGKKK